MECNENDKRTLPTAAGDKTATVKDTALQIEIEAERFVSQSSSEEYLDGVVLAKDKNECCLPRGHRIVHTAVAEHPLSNNVKEFDLITKPNLAVQNLEARASCTNGLYITEAAIVAATTSTANTSRTSMNLVGHKANAKCEDMQTQYNALGEQDGAPSQSDSMPSIGSLVCRICHNADNPEQLVSPCLCKGSMTYVHIHCLERWISTSRCTTCELCQFTYNTEQTLRYTCLQSLRLWYSRSMSRRALQEDCQMFSLLTLVAFGIVGTLLVGIQYYALHSQSWGLSKLWTKSWMLFFLFMTVTVYFANVYMLIKSQLTPWYRWWQSARDIKLILENRRPFRNPSKVREDAISSLSLYTHHDMRDLNQQDEAQLQSPQSQQQSEQQSEQQLPALSTPAPPPPEIPLNLALLPESIGTFIELRKLLQKEPVFYELEQMEIAKNLENETSSNTAVPEIKTGSSKTPEGTVKPLECCCANCATRCECYKAETVV